VCAFGVSACFDAPMRRAALLMTLLLLVLWVIALATGGATVAWLQARPSDGGPWIPARSEDLLEVASATTVSTPVSRTT